MGPNTSVYLGTWSLWVGYFMNSWCFKQGSVLARLAANGLWPWLSCDLAVRRYTSLLWFGFLAILALTTKMATKSITLRNKYTFIYSRFSRHIRFPTSITLCNTLSYSRLSSHNKSLNSQVSHGGPSVGPRRGWLQPPGRRARAQGELHPTQRVHRTQIRSICP